MFSKACQYAIRAITLLAMEGRKGRRMALVEIAERTGTPRAFTAKVLQQLVRAGLLDSVKGPGGGFDLPPQKARQVTLSMVVKAIDNDDVYRGCGMGLPQCNARKPCPLHEQFQHVRENLRIMLESTNLHDLSMDLERGVTFLK
ncbi:MAG: Rrf2 family transcriptional regulator [Bacteroidetes bacterium]|nr:Rrf2 family transcriptional regulator [Bacteroidota bacterium]